MSKPDPFGETFGSEDSHEDVLGETLDGREGLLDGQLRGLIGPVFPLMAPAYGFERVMMRARRRRQRKIMLSATAVLTGLAVASGGVLLGFRASGNQVQIATGCGGWTNLSGRTDLSDHVGDGAGAVDAAAVAPGGLGRGATMQRKYEWAIGGVLTAGALAGGIFAGCSNTNNGNGNSASNVPTTSASPAQTGGSVVPSPQQTPSLYGAGASPISTGPQRCHTNDLSPTVTVVNGSSAAGHQLLNLTLTNTSGRTCTIFGYPGMMLEDQNDSGQSTTVTRDPAVPKKTITVPNGGSASTTIRFDFDVPGPGEPTTGNCEPPSYSLLITPPDETTQLTAPIGGGPVTVCERGTLDVLPFVSGTTGANQ
jgi:uncharacterized protein DUF4232